MDTDDGEAYRADRGDSLLAEFASASAQASMATRIRMSEAVQQGEVCQATGKSCLDSCFRRHKRPLGENDWQIDLYQ